MNKLSIDIDNKLYHEIDRLRKPLGLNLTQVVTEALRTWIKRKEASFFEQEWIETLKKRPDDAKRTEDWFDAQAW